MKLSLKDRFALLNLFQDDAAKNGPAGAAFCLIELDVVVPEPELYWVFRNLGWTNQEIHKLALLAPHHLTL